MSATVFAALFAIVSATVSATAFATIWTMPSQATITEISDVTDVDLRRGGDEAVLEMLKANPKVTLTLHTSDI